MEIKNKLNLSKKEWELIVLAVKTRAENSWENATLSNHEKREHLIWRRLFEKLSGRKMKNLDLD